jgi:hypothetical protein
MTARKVTIALNANAPGDRSGSAPSQEAISWADRVADRIAGHEAVASSDLHIYSEPSRSSSRDWRFEAQVDMPDVDQARITELEQESAENAREQLMRVLHSRTGQTATGELTRKGDRWQVTIKFEAEVPGYNKPSDLKALEKWANPIADQMAKVDGVGKDLTIESWHERDGVRRFCFRADVTAPETPEIRQLRSDAKARAEQIQQDLVRLALAEPGAPRKVSSVSVA